MPHNANRIFESILLELLSAVAAKSKEARTNCVDAFNKLNKNATAAFSDTGDAGIALMMMMTNRIFVYILLGFLITIAAKWEDARTIAHRHF